MSDSEYQIILVVGLFIIFEIFNYPFVWCSHIPVPYIPVPRYTVTDHVIFEPRFNFNRGSISFLIVSSGLRPLVFRFSEIMHMQIIILIYKAICMQCENPWKFRNCNKTADFEWYAFLIDPFWSILSVKHTTFPNWKFLLLHFRDVFVRFVSAWFESGSKYWFDKQPWNN